MGTDGRTKIINAAQLHCRCADFLAIIIDGIYQRSERSIRRGWMRGRWLWVPGVLLLGFGPALAFTSNSATERTVVQLVMSPLSATSSSARGARMRRGRKSQGIESADETGKSAKRPMAIVWRGM
jgi:hypothetical protein